MQLRDLSAACQRLKARDTHLERCCTPVARPCGPAAGKQLAQHTVCAARSRLNAANSHTCHLDNSSVLHRLPVCSLLTSDGAMQRKPSGTANARKLVPKPVNLPSQRKVSAPAGFWLLQQAHLLLCMLSMVLLTLLLLLSRCRMCTAARVLWWCGWQAVPACSCLCANTRTACLRLCNAGNSKFGETCTAVASARVFWHVMDCDGSASLTSTALLLAASSSQAPCPPGMSALLSIQVALFCCTPIHYIRTFCRIVTRTQAASSASRVAAPTKTAGRSPSRKARSRFSPPPGTAPATAGRAATMPAAAAAAARMSTAWGALRRRSTRTTSPR